MLRGWHQQPTTSQHDEDSVGRDDRQRLSLSEFPSVVPLTRPTSAIHRVRRKSAPRLSFDGQSFDETERKSVPIARVRSLGQGATEDVSHISRTSFAPMVDHDSPTQPRLAKPSGLERTRSRRRPRQTFRVAYGSISRTTSRTGPQSEFRRLLSQAMALASAAMRLCLVLITR